MKEASWPRWAAPLAVAAASAVLLIHAHRFDFICDDAYITFRYAKNLVALHAPIYNVGERVEGYSNFLWMLLAALGLKAGLDIPPLVVLLGALSAVVLMGGLLLVWRSFAVLPRWPLLVVMALVAMTAPVAVWTLGGLETCLYAGLLAVSCALGASAAATGGTTAAAMAGACLALATLTRPEGPVAFATVFGAVLLLQMGKEDALRTIGALTWGYLVIVLPHLAFRRSYYGDWLPNTFYQKTSGVPAEMHSNGVAYLRLAAHDFGWAAGVLGLGVMTPAAPALSGESVDAVRLRRACLWLLRLNVLAVLAFIVWVGGDFQAGYRFMVPALPLALVLVVAAASQWVAVLIARFRSSPARVSLARWVGAVAGGLLFIGYGAQQYALRGIIEEGRRPGDSGIEVEELKWTRIYAQRWVALGRWIAERSQPGDWMAIGAAGATPYYAGLNNLDLYGLCDRYVARYGTVLGSKPGHQRWAPKEYVAERRPTFLFYSGTRITEAREPFGRDGWWERQGYVSVVATIDAKYGAPGPYYIHFLMRKDRARALRSDPTLSIDLAEL
jgi:hypothetical protein